MAEQQEQHNHIQVDDQALMDRIQARFSQELAAVIRHNATLEVALEQVLQERDQYKAMAEELAEQAGDKTPTKRTGGSGGKKRK